MTRRSAFKRAFRAYRIAMKHRIAGTQAFKRLDDAALDMLPLALRCRRYPEGYHTSGGLWFARGAAKNGYSFKAAVRMYLRAVRHRMWRASRPDLFARAA